MQLLLSELLWKFIRDKTTETNLQFQIKQQRQIHSRRTSFCTKSQIFCQILSTHSSLNLLSLLFWSCFGWLKTLETITNDVWFTGFNRICLSVRSRTGQSFTSRLNLKKFTLSFYFPVRKPEFISKSCKNVLYFSYYMDVCVYMCHIWELCHIYWRENMTLKRIFWTFIKLKHHFGIRTDYWYFVLTRNTNCQNWERTIPRIRFQIWPPD